MFRTVGLGDRSTIAAPWFEALTRVFKPCESMKVASLRSTTNSRPLSGAGRQQLLGRGHVDVSPDLDDDLVGMLFARLQRSSCSHPSPCPAPRPVVCLWRHPEYFFASILASRPHAQTLGHERPRSRGASAGSTIGGRSRSHHTHFLFANDVYPPPVAELVDDQETPAAFV